MWPTLREQGIDIPRLARVGVEIFFTQVFRDGYFHADMHPGNIFVGSDGRYIAVISASWAPLPTKTRIIWHKIFLHFSGAITNGWRKPMSRQDGRQKYPR